VLALDPDNGNTRMGLNKGVAMLDQINQLLDFQSRALLLRSERQKLLAGNIANADTPNYKAVDFDFGAALSAASGAQDAPRPTRTHAAHLAAGAAQGGAQPALLYRMPPQAALDQNTVDMDLERARFADNAVRFEATLRFINGQIRTVTSAMSNNG